MREKLTDGKGFVITKSLKTVAIASFLTLIIVSFQNCNDKVNFRSIENSTSGQSDSSSSKEGEFAASGALASYKVGSLYGACTMQIEENLMIAHNGVLDKNGNRLSIVPEGVGGATWPLTNCPHEGNYKSASITCASGFKPVLTEYSQMDCRSNAGAPACSTYWATYACARLDSGVVTPPTSSQTHVDYAPGSIAGSCIQQLDKDFIAVSRTHVDSILTESNVGAVWPVTSCPDNKTNLDVTCAAGWKLVTQSFVQFVCPGTPVGGHCNRYIVRSSCAKL